MFGFMKAKNSGIISSFNPFTFSNSVSYKKIISKTLRDFKEETFSLYPKALTKKEIYTIYENVSFESDKLLFETSKVNYFMIQVLPGKIGSEFHKTNAFEIKKNDVSFPGVFEVMSGFGVVLIENLEEDGKELNIVKVKTGDKFVLSENYCCTIWNCAEESLIISGIRGKETELEFETLRKQYGPSLFFTDNGFVKNKNISPFYILHEYDGSFMLDFKFEKDLYEEFKLLPEKFNFLN